MESSPADLAGASDVAVADLPTTSGAHWANRDSLRDRQPFRRPAAANSFPGEPEMTAAGNTEQPWDAFGAASESTAAERAPMPAHDPMTDTGARSRASFGMTDDPISGNWFGRDPSPVSPAAAPPFEQPAPPYEQRTPPYEQSAPPFEQSAPLAVELPVRTVEQAPHWNSPQMPPAREPENTGHTTAGDQSGDWEQTSGGWGRPGGGWEQPGAGWGEGRDIRPHRATRHDSDTGREQTHHASAPPRRSKAMTVATVALSAVVLFGGVAAGVAYFTGDDKGLGSILPIGAESSAGNNAGNTAATAPLGNRSSASFELAAPTRRAVVKTQDLGDDLYRITAAGDAGTTPRPTVSGDRVQLLLAAEGAATARGDVEVVLSSKVTWALKLTGGADEQVVNLTGGQLNAVELTGDSRRVDLTLPRPTGTVPLNITGSVEDLSLTSPAGSPIRVKVDGGVKTVAAGERTLKDLKPGSTLTPKDWKAANRYDVSAETRLTLLTVRNVDQ